MRARFLCQHAEGFFGVRMCALSAKTTAMPHYPPAFLSVRLPGAARDRLAAAAARGKTVQGLVSNLVESDSSPTNAAGHPTSPAFCAPCAAMAQPCGSAA